MCGPRDNEVYHGRRLSGVMGLGVVFYPVCQACC